MEAREELGVVKFNYEAKLKELLRNLTSVEIELCSDASKEFIKILNSDSGIDFIRLYVQVSSNLLEISQAWGLRKGKPGFSHILGLVSAILKHCRGYVGKDDDNVCRSLDKFALGVIKEKIEDLYKELSSKEGKKQNAVLLLLATIVRRNSYLAWEVAKDFDFKLHISPKLADVRLRVKEFVNTRKKSDSTRKAFVAFAMSFLEVGNPRLLSGILRQKEMYSGVLRGLGNDEEETVVYILSILRDRVLVPESLVPPALRSVLFGSVTLEQLVNISARSDFVDAAELAHDVLLLVCTNPVNGLMPDLERQPSPLRGNQKRLLDLMKKLKATEIEYHKVLLLAIVKGKPAIASAYLDEFPYNLEDLSSANWPATICLAADVVSAVSDGISFGFMCKPPELDNLDVQNILKCIGPRPFTKLVMNKGLLHSDTFVKHGTLRLVLEVFKLLDYFLNTLDQSSNLNDQVKGWAALKAVIQDGVRLLLPDPQVLLSLLSHLNSHIERPESNKKRKAETRCGSDLNANSKKRKRVPTTKEESDILVVGVDTFSEVDIAADSPADPIDEQPSENGINVMKDIGDMWGLSKCSTIFNDIGNEDTYFYSKLLDTLTIYSRTMPMALEGLFDFFKLIPSNPLSLPSVLLQSLLNLLEEYVGQYSKEVTLVRTQPQMYKHLHPFIVLMLYSPAREIREQAYVFSKEVMLSTGAFYNPRDPCAWFFFIPGYNGNHVYIGDTEVKIFQNLSSVIVTFLCDAVTTTGNNLYKYMELLKYYSKADKALSPNVSPFTVCALENCLRLLVSVPSSFSFRGKGAEGKGNKSKSPTLPQKSIISLYVCNTVKYILDTQVDPGPLSFLINRVLTEKLENVNGCEWRPLKALLGCARTLLHRQCYSIPSNVKEVTQSSNSLLNVLCDMRKVLRNEYDVGIVELTVGFSSSLMCTRPAHLLQQFPIILCIANNLLKAPFSVLASIFFLESSYLTDISTSWPEMFMSCLIGSIEVKETKTKEKSFGKGDIDSKEAALVALENYLTRAPFWVLFSSVIQSGNLHLFDQSALQKLLLDKLAHMPWDHMVSSLCSVLFWMNHLRSSYRLESFDQLMVVSRVCYVLAEHLLKQLLVEKVDASHPGQVNASLKLDYAIEVAEIVLDHPFVKASLNIPLAVTEEFSDSVFKETPEALEKFVEKGVHPMDQHVLNLVKTVFEVLFSICNGQSLEQASNRRKQMLEAFGAHKQGLFLVFKDKFDRCIQSTNFQPLVPTFYALCSLRRFIAPFKLLELVSWCFSRIDCKDTTFNFQSKETTLLICLHLAWCTFDILSARSYSESYCSLDGTDEIHSDALLFERTLLQVLEIACHHRLDTADTCLLKAVKVVKRHKVLQHQNLLSMMVLSRVVASAPVNIVSHCLNRINRTKAELLNLIAEISPLHLSIFGYRFSEMLNKSFLSNAKPTQEASESVSDEELTMLLPTVYLYLNSSISRSGGQLSKNFESILLVYGRIVLDGFSVWKTLVSWNLPAVEPDEILPTSIEEYLDRFSNSLLGKVVLMMRHFPAVSEELIKFGGRLDRFNSLCPYDGTHGSFFDFDSSKIELYSPKQSFEYANRVVAKINFCRMLLLLDHNQLQSESQQGDKPLEVEDDMQKSRIRFLRTLINSWRWIVKKLPDNVDDYSGNVHGQKFSPIKFLEIFLMSNISDLTKEMHDCLNQLSSVPFIEQLVKSFLLYRFGDILTLEMLQNVLTALCQEKFSCSSAMQLLLAHSQFVKSIQMAGKSLGTQFGLIFTPMRSILRTLVIPQPSKDILDCKISISASQQHFNLLEFVKLVRLFFRICTQQTNVNIGEEIGINSRELVYLFLSSYGATCSQLDMEIYDLIQEIESNDRSSAGTLAQVDYLWGIASLKLRTHLEQDKNIDSDDPINIDSFEEQRKIQFRENLPIDPKLCAQTVLHFPYFRFVNAGNVHNLQKDNFSIVQEASCMASDKQTYDPVFILRFSIHALLMSYIEPIEFASLGLLAITFVSMSSPDINMRKLGYETLPKFKAALEKCQKKKVVKQILLLVTYLQNGIAKDWKMIPSVIAVFFAEASMVLLDPSHEHYTTISKYLMSSLGVNMKAVPLFQQFFWSTSVSFKADRLWMLRLLYVGLNTKADAKIYIRNSVFDMLISFYSSPLSDNDSKELIIQIVKKAVQLPKAARVLVQKGGLILWLSSIVSSLCGSESQDKKLFAFTLLPIILEVVNDVTLHRDIVEWMQNHAFEQLSELSSHLYKLLVGGVALFKEQANTCNSILQIFRLVLGTSQTRQINRPHFSLSDEGSYQLYKVVEACSKTTSNATVVLGLEVVLMCNPPVTLLQMDQEKLSNFLKWAITTASQCTSTKALQPDKSLIAVTGKGFPKESLMSKLLHWLSASVILGKVSYKLSKLKSDSFFEKPSLDSWLSLLELNEKKHDENARYGSEDILALSMFYLLQLLGFHHELLPSVVPALCLLLFSGSPDVVDGLGSSLSSLCLKVKCPAEANPAWRWSFDQPWTDISLESEKLDERHAYERLLTVASNTVLKKNLGSDHCIIKDIDQLHVYDWERNLLNPQ